MAVTYSPQLIRLPPILSQTLSTERPPHCSLTPVRRSAPSALSRRSLGACRRAARTFPRCTSRCTKTLQIQPESCVLCVHTSALPVPATNGSSARDPGRSCSQVTQTVIMSRLNVRSKLFLPMSFSSRQPALAVEVRRALPSRAPRLLPSSAPAPFPRSSRLALLVHPYLSAGCPPVSSTLPPMPDPRPPTPSSTFDFRLSIFGCRFSAVASPLLTF